MPLHLLNKNMESKLKKEGKDLSDINLEEMEYWQCAKNEYLNS